MRAGALCLLAALSPAGACAGDALGFDDARHLLNRTGFAASPAEITAFARLTRAEAADRLLAKVPPEALTPPPDWSGAPFESLRRFRDMSAEERKLARRETLRQAFELQSWWLAEMLATPAPLLERMTLFWHNHFVSSFQKVRSPQLLYRQNLLLRRHALGNFGALLRAVARDPAMLVYLDNAVSRRGQPNENFARELMELFTLGEGNYGEADVKEAARAFTGWSIDYETGEFRFRPGTHDDGVKTVLAVTGRLDGEAVLDLLLAHPRTAEHIAGKLWREFVSPRPAPSERARVARAFRESGYDIRAALRAIFVSDAFYAPENRAVLVKSPVELIVGTLRQFEVRTGDVMPFVVTANQLGQRLFAPPNVKGWPGGESWINSSTLLARKAFLERLLRVEEPREMPREAMTVGPARPAGVPVLAGGVERYVRGMLEARFDGERWLAEFGGGRDVEKLKRVVLATAPAGPPPGEIRYGMDLARYLTQDAAYQLR
ncbi:MAG: DUF1800 domain-containing protein [Burkholderiales bacterium]|nr:DUF1800 domain-containing protein [Burkholderiales bacterium]